MARLPKGYDVSDWLEARDAAEPDDLRRELQALIDAAPDFTPSQVESAAVAKRPLLAPGTVVRPNDRDNFGEVLADDGETVTVHFRSKDGQEAEVEFLAAELRLQDGRPVVAVELPAVMTLGELIAAYPERREPVINGILRRNEVANLIAKSKVGKSWTAYSLGLSVTAGLRWLGSFDCMPGDVLLIDNELHREDIVHRIPLVAEALGIVDTDYLDRFHVLSLRGRHRDIFQLGALLDESIRGKYSLVIVDALYRMFPPDMSENDNAAMAQLYNAVDNYAEATGAAFVLIHHATKGYQGEKDVTDVGSGASSQARAADTHLVLRPHEEDGCVVLDAAVRSFEPVEPVVLRWHFPIWLPESGLDPAKLKTARQTQTVEDRQRKFDDRRRQVVEFLGSPGVRQTGASKTTIRDRTGISTGLAKVLDSLVTDKNLVVCEIVHAGNKQRIQGWKIHPDE